MVIEGCLHVASVVWNLLHWLWIEGPKIYCLCRIVFFPQSLLLFQLNAHNMFNTYIYHQLPPTCFDVCYTIFGVTIALLECCYIGCTVKCKLYPVFFLIYSAVTMFKTICISSFCIWKVLVKILNCSTLMYLKNLKILVKILNCGTLMYLETLKI